MNSFKRKACFQLRTLMKTNYRLMSSESKFLQSNYSLTSFSTIGEDSQDFQGFVKSLDPNSYANVLQKGNPLWGEINSVSREALAEGSKAAIEAVTETLSSDMNLEESELREQLTPECYQKLKVILSNFNSEQKSALSIHEDEIIVTWIPQPKGETKDVRVCTISFPAYAHMKNKIKEMYKKEISFKENLTKEIQEDKIDRQDTALAFVEFEKTIAEEKRGFGKHMTSNNLVVGNWDFTQVI